MTYRPWRHVHDFLTQLESFDILVCNFLSPNHNYSVIHAECITFQGKNMPFPSYLTKRPPSSHPTPPFFSAWGPCGSSVWVPDPPNMWLQFLPRALCDAQSLQVRGFCPSHVAFYYRQLTGRRRPHAAAAGEAAVVEAPRSAGEIWRSRQALRWLPARPSRGPRHERHEPHRTAGGPRGCPEHTNVPEGPGRPACTSTSNSPHRDLAYKLSVPSSRKQHIVDKIKHHKSDFYCYEA